MRLSCREVARPVSEADVGPAETPTASPKAMAAQVIFALMLLPLTLQARIGTRRPLKPGRIAHSPIVRCTLFNTARVDQPARRIFGDALRGCIAWLLA